MAEGPPREPWSQFHNAYPHAYTHAHQHTQRYGEGHVYEEGLNRLPNIAGEKRKLYEAAGPRAQSGYPNNTHTQPPQSRNKKRRPNKKKHPPPPPPPPVDQLDETDTGQSQEPSKFPEIEEGTTGYKRPKDFDYSQPFPARVVLPPWLREEESDCPCIPQRPPACIIFCVVRVLH